jgi:tetratricopeptide (TPR) repeat protein
MESEDYDRSKAFASDALSKFRDMRHRYGVAHCRLLLGEIYRAEGDFEDAARILEDALETFQNCGDPWMTGVAMETLALNRGDQGYATDAADLVEQAYKIFEVLAEEHLPRKSPRFISPSERTVRTPRSVRRS